MDTTHVGSMKGEQDAEGYFGLNEARAGFGVEQSIWN